MTPEAWLKKAETLRELVFGFGSWRGEQAAVMDAVAVGKNALVVMPTGMGKSLCYQVPARIFREQGESGLVLVVSPLIALMKDQVDSARQKGLNAVAIHSAMPREERERVLRAVGSPGPARPELLYATPERFRSDEFRQALATGGGVRLLAVDEAHCISTWGHDFRLDYSRLGDRRSEIGSPQTLALTATATPDTQKDILRELKIADAAVVAADVWRPNLAIEVLETMGIDEKIRALVMLMHRRPGNTIFYFSLVKTLEAFSIALDRLGFEHVIYHGQLPDRLRKRNQDSFLAGRARLMLATPAFGLGVDKPDVRLLVHGEIPGSIESYYQEIGRAGRDGELSDCVLLYDRDDVSIQQDFLKWSAPDPGFIQSVHRLIERNELRARQEGFDYLRSQMNFYNRRDFRVETSVQLLERWGALEGREPREWKVVAEIPPEFLDQKAYAASLKRREEKLQSVVGFAEATDGCRMARVTQVFSSGRIASDRRCGVCDHCRAAIR